MGGGRSHDFPRVRSERPRIPESRGPDLGRRRAGLQVDQIRQDVAAGERLSPGCAELELRRRSDRSQDRGVRSEEHTSELQSLAYLVCRLLLEKKKKR